MFTSECPVFIPREYLNATRLRLDSNILFYQHIKETGENRVTDIFAVKGGEPRVVEVAKWSGTYGFNFVGNINRWDRRVNLKGVIFENSLGDYGYQAHLIKDNNGALRSYGWFQDVLFYVTDGLDLAMKIKKNPLTRGWKKLNNGTWTGGIGVLQRKEADIVSSAVGVTLERDSVVDYPLPIIHRSCSFIAAIPKGASLNIWAYVQVCKFSAK